MCNSCGYNPCTCSNPVYSYNWYNTENLPCDPCSTTPVCKKKIPAKCTFYQSATLVNLNLPTGTNIEAIIQVIDSAIGVLKAFQATQTTKNTNILTALNDINDRLNVLEGGSHAAYTI